MCVESTVFRIRLLSLSLGQSTLRFEFNQLTDDEPRDKGGRKLARGGDKTKEKTVAKPKTKKSPLSPQYVARLD